VKKTKTEISNQKILNQQQNSEIKMIPQIQQYPINPAYSYYPNVGIYNPLVAAQSAPYYPILAEQMNLQNQVPIISNYPTRNGSTQLPNSYIYPNPITSMQNPQIATQLPTPIPNQLTAQIPNQIPTQIATQITPQIAPQLSPQIVQPASTVYPIFNMNKDTYNGTSKNKGQTKIIDLTEINNTNNNNNNSNNNNNTNDVNNRDIIEELDINISIDNDDKTVLINKIKHARKNLEYYNSLCKKYEKFIDNATLRLNTLEKGEKSIKESEKQEEKDEPIIIEIKKEKIEGNEISEKLNKLGKREKEEKIRENQGKYEKHEKHEKRSKENDIKNNGNRLNSSYSGSPKLKYERNIISAPSFKEQFMNLENNKNNIKKRESADLLGSSVKRLKTSSENDNLKSNYKLSSPILKNKSFLNNNKSTISKPSLINNPLLNNNKSVPIPPNSSSMSTMALNKRNPMSIINSSIKVTNQKEEIREIKIQSQASKTRVLAKNMQYVKKITKRKPRKFIHLINSNTMVITDLGGEIVTYNTKQKKEISVAYVANGGWCEDICTFSDKMFAFSILNKNRPAESQIAMLSFNYGLGTPKIHLFKNNKPHENSSIRIAPISIYNNTYRLASAGADHNLFLWEIKEDDRDNFEVKKVNLLHKKHTSAIQTVYYNTWNNVIYSGGSDCKLFGYSLINNRIELKNRYDMRISNIIRNPVDPNQLLITYSNTKDQFRICDIRSKKTILNFGIPTNENVSQYVYPDFHRNGYLVSFGSQRIDTDKANVYIWDIRYINPTNSYVSDIKLQQGRIIKPLFHPSKSQIITIDTNGTAAFINYQTVNENI